MRRSVGYLLLAALLVACSESAGPATNTPESTFTARINGQPWVSGPGGVLTNGIAYAQPGVYVITGAATGGYELSIELHNIGKTGSYPLGVGSSVAGGTLVVSDANDGWSTALTGAAGAIQITTLTATRIAGTFSATLTPILEEESSGIVSVSEGKFDLQVVANGTVGPLPESAGGSVSATLNDVDFNASAVSSSYLVASIGGGTLTVNASNHFRSLTIELRGVSEPGEYALSTGGMVGDDPRSIRFITASNVTNTSSNSWNSYGPGSSGTVTVTTLSSSRIIGTFSATLLPASNSQTVETMTIVNGAFNVGRGGAP